MTLGSPTRTIGIRYGRSSAALLNSPTTILPVSISIDTLVSSDPTAPIHLDTADTFPRLPTIDNPSTPLTTGAAPEAAKADMSSTNSINTSRVTTPSFTRSASPWSPDSSEPHTPSSGQTSPRGRTLSIAETNMRLLTRASTRRRAGPTSIDFDGGQMEARSRSRDFSADALDMHDAILEPRPLLAVDTFSEVLHRSSTIGSSINLMGFGGHRDTFAVLGFRHQPQRAPDLPSWFFERFVRFISHDTYLAIRLSCRSWSVAITEAQPQRLPPVYYLPQEVLELVFRHLDPVDFNAARHTCRAWMMASLEWQLLITMLKRGGWWEGFQADLMAHGPSSLLRTNVNEEWLMSKRLATECSLSPGWTGNGLKPRRASYAPYVYQADSTLLGETADKTGLILTSHIDFSEFSDSYYNAGDTTLPAPALQFTVSVCNQFVLFTDGCTIYIYRLRDDAASQSNFAANSASYIANLTPLTSVICPRRVLAVSMDTSSKRFAIAALLDGRMGLVCDLQTDSSRRSSHAHNGTTAHTSDPGHPSTSSTPPAPDHHIASIHNHPRSRSWSTGASGEDNLHARHGTFSHPLGPTTSHPIPIESGPRSLYRNLCSPDQPPLSVAICPQRRCVAFGCAAGIELHWVDALTGQDLNRWFPLAAAAECLWFLPPRAGVDSAKKLRLIASERWRPAPGGAKDVGAETDHFRARPLSDGYHILFTDPASGSLCLGSDAPLGGPTKLLRKVVFWGPQGGVVPTVYAAGSDLRWGVRVAVGYGERLWLFSVPPDVFGAGRFKAGYGAESPRGELWGEGLREEVEDAEGAWSGKWPVRVRGVEVATVRGLVDVAVEAETGRFTVWAFSAAGEAFTWGIDGGMDVGVCERAVLRDGAVVDVRDADGDVIMRDAPDVVMPELRVGGRAVGYDGVASMFLTAAQGLRLEPVDAVGRSGCCWVERVVEGGRDEGVGDSDSGYGSDEEGVVQAERDL